MLNVVAIITEQEIRDIQSARAWIFHEVLYGDSPAIQKDAKKITDTLDRIIEKVDKLFDAIEPDE